jgi:hypothetical protein
MSVQSKGDAIEDGRPLKSVIINELKQLLPNISRGAAIGPGVANVTFFFKV